MIWEWEVERVVKQDTQYTAKYGETVTLEHSWLQTTTTTITSTTTTTTTTFFSHDHVTWIFLK